MSDGLQLAAEGKAYDAGYRAALEHAAQYLRHCKKCPCGCGETLKPDTRFVLLRAAEQIEKIDDE